MYLYHRINYIFIWFKAYYYDQQLYYFLTIIVFLSFPTTLVKRLFFKFGFIVKHFFLSSKFIIQSIDVLINAL